MIYKNAMYESLAFAGKIIKSIEYICKNVDYVTYLNKRKNNEHLNASARFMGLSGKFNNFQWKFDYF